MSLHRLKIAIALLFRKLRRVGTQQIVVFCSIRRQAAKGVSVDFESLPFEFVDCFGHRINIMENQQIRNQVATRLTMAFLSQRFDWRDALVIVQPRILLRWPRQCYRMLWRNKSRAGRPAIPQELQRLIRRMANENITWGEERIANELLLKLGIAVSPRTVRKYMPKRSNHSGPRGDQRWSTFLKNHASAIVACDFCVVVTAIFRVLYAFALIEHGSKRLIHTSVTDKPTADWARPQIREAIPSDHQYRFLIHDRDCVFSAEFDKTILNRGIKPIKTPCRSPKANAICERVIGTLRRQYLDYVIPLSERHLQGILKLWVAHYNRSRPHSALGPDIPSRVAKPSAMVVQLRRNIKPTDRIIATSILGGVHHDYQLMVAYRMIEYLRTTVIFYQDAKAPCLRSL